MFDHLSPEQRDTIAFHQAPNVPASWFCGEVQADGSVEVIALGDRFAWSFRIERDGSDHSSEARVGDFSTGINV